MQQGISVCHHALSVINPNKYYIFDKDTEKRQPYHYFINSQGCLGPLSKNASLSLGSPKSTGATTDTIKTS